MKQLIGIDNCISYTFNASAKTIAISCPLMPSLSITLKNIIYINNATLMKEMYSVTNKSYPATVTNNVVSLSCDNTGMTNTDEVQIYVNI